MSPAEPARRRDGRCACGCGKRLRSSPRTPVSRALLKAGPDPYSRDPFASRECCERFHGIKRRSGPSASAEEPEPA